MTKTTKTLKRGERRSTSYGDDVRAFVRRSTRASGVPYHVEDGPTLARIAEIFVGAVDMNTE